MTRPDDFSRALLRYAAPPPVQAEEHELDALGILRLVRRRIWLIVAVTVLVTAASLPAILAMEPVYYAESRLLIQNPMATTLTSSAEDRIVRLNVTTEVERLYSRDTAIRVIRALGLDELPEFNPTLRDVPANDRLKGFLRGLLAGAEDTAPLPLDPMDQVIPEYFDALRINRDAASDIVQIGFFSHDPELAATAPNTLLHVYLDERQSHFTDEVQQANDWLGQRIEEQRARIAAATHAVQQFGVASGLSTGDPKLGSAQTISSLNEQRTDLAQKRTELTTTLSAIDALATRADQVALTTSTVLAGLSRDLQIQQFDLARLLGIYGNSQEEVIAARAKISETEAQLDAEIGRYIQSLTNRLTFLDRQDEALLVELGAARSALARQDAAETQREELQRVVDAEQAALETLEAQQRTLTAEGKLPVADVEVLSPATIPLSPSGRGRAFYLFAAVVVAGMLGITAACALELLDRSVRSHQQLHAIAGVLPAGMVPALPRRIARKLPALVRHRPAGMFGSSIRGIVLSLEQSNDGKMPASVLVTSSLPGEGKSLLATAIALDVAASGRRVLLVDGDLTQGRIHTLFGSAAAPGLSDFMRGVSDLGPLVRTHADSGIDYIPRGAGSGALPAERDLFAALLKLATDNGQILIFDSAPVLAGADATLIASQAERTLLVTRWGRTSRHAIESSVERLLNARQEHILVAINMVNPRRHAIYGFKDAEIFSRSLLRYQAKYN